MPSKSLSNPGGAYGYTADVDGGSALVGYFRSAESSTTIAQGNLVSINTAGKILQSATNVAPKLCIGFAAEAIAPGEIGPVVTNGFFAGALNDGTDVTAGQALIRSDATAGAVEPITIDDTNRSLDIVAIAVDTTTGTSSNVWVVR